MEIINLRSRAAALLTAADQLGNRHPADSADYRRRALNLLDRAATLEMLRAAAPRGWDVID